MIQTPIRRRDFRTLCCGLVLALGAACSGTGAGQIPCRDTTNCPGDFPTCSAAGFCVNNAPAASIEVVSGDAQTGVVGNALAQPLVIRVLDTNGNAVPAFGVTWSVGTGAGQVSAGSTTTGPDGKASITATVGTIAGANSFTAAAAGLTGSPKTFTATGIADVATTLVLTGASATTAGDVQPFTLTAKDTHGNVATGYRGAVTFTSTDGAATLPTLYTFTAADAGIHQFSVTLKTAGARSVTAGDGSLTITKPGIAVGPAAASTLSVTGFSNTVTAGTAGTVTVTARDAFGNVATGYLGAVQITTDNPNPSLPEPNHTFTAGEGGVHVFPVTLKGAADSSIATFSIIATDTVTATITGSQTGITVNPDVAVTLQVVGFPNSVTAGAGGNVAVTALDSFGNTATGYRGTVHITSSGAATLPANHMYTATDAGVHSFVVTLKTASANSSITATDAVTTSITGIQSGIVVDAGANNLLVAGFPSTVLAGSPGSVTVTARNVDNSIATVYRGTVHFTSSDTTATLPPDYDFTALDAGAHTFTGVILNTTTGTASITVTDAANGTITGSQTGIVVNVGPLVFGATATRISGGSRGGLIFIAGGSASTSTVSPLSNTWFYNPANSSLTAGPTLAFGRYLHTATAFGVGQVLVAGGSPGTLPMGFTEFELCDLDSATPTCAASGTLATTRCNAAAALVSATQVLIAGGDNCANTTALRTWDLWDSAAPTTPVSDNGGTNRLTVGRRLLTATVVVPGSKVLLAGGAATATADVFTLNAGTPASSTVAATAMGMIGTRTGHTATLLTSTTATTACPSAPTSCVLLAGGNATPGKTWEIYDASTNTFPRNATTAGADLVLLARQFHAAAAFANGKVLIAGGTNGATAQSTTEAFDPAAGTLTFSVGLGLQLARFRTAAVYAPAQDVLVLVGGNSVGPSTEQVTTPP